MKFHRTVVAGTLLGACWAAAAQAYTPGVQVTVEGEVTPGVYGRVELGNRPPPVLVYPQPVVIVQPARPVRQPVYMHVPPGHAKNWGKHCSKYNACSQPVYFVRSAEYERYDDRGDHGDRKHGKDHGDKPGKGRGHKHGD